MKNTVNSQTSTERFVSVLLLFILSLFAIGSIYAIYNNNKEYNKCLDNAKNAKETTDCVFIYK